MYLKIAVSAALMLALALPATASAKGPFVEPDDLPDPRGLTMQGSGLSRVERPKRLSERTIGRAVDAARAAAQAKALRNARRRARALARVAGLTLGSVQAVADRVLDSERFGIPGRHCGRRGCRVPPLAGASVRVTFARSRPRRSLPRRAIVASGSATVPVHPRRRNSPSIRAALARAQLVADPLALRSAGRRAAGVAWAADMRPGALFALAEEPRQPFAADIVTNVYGGPGRFCSSPRRGRRARAGRPHARSRVRRCYIPEANSVLRVTLAALPYSRPSSATISSSAAPNTSSRQRQRAPSSISVRPSAR